MGLIDTPPLPMFLAHIASMKQWDIFYRESGVEKGPGGITISFYFSTWHPCVFHVFEMLPCITSKNYYFLKEKPFTDFMSDFPEGERCACCWPAWHQCTKHAFITLLNIKTQFIAFPEKCNLRLNSLYEIYGRQILYQVSV